MLSQKFLMDNHVLTGTDATEFKNALAELDDATGTIVFDPRAGKKRNKMRFFAAGYVAGEKGVFECPPNVDDGMFGTFYGDGMLSDDEMLMKKYDEDIKDEVFASSGAFALVESGGKTIMCPISREVMDRDTKQFKMELLAEEKADYHFLGKLGQRMANQTFTFCVRTSEDGVTKVFGIRSGKYGHFPQAEVYECIEDAFSDERIEMTKWSIDNVSTEAVLALPEYAVERQYGRTKKTFIPNILFETSDVGVSSAVARLFWTDGYNVMFLASGETKASRKHYGDWSMQARDDFIKSLKDLKPKVNALIEQLDKLECIQIENEYIPAVIDSWFDDSKVRRLNKVNAEKYKEIAVNHFAGRDTTAAELCQFLMAMPASFKDALSAISIRALQEALAEIPYKPVRKGIITTKHV